MTNEVIDGILARIRKMPGFEHSKREGLVAPKSVIEKFLAATQCEFGGSEAYLRHHGVQQSTIDNFRESLLS